MNATKEVIYKIMRSRKSRTWMPYEVQHELFKLGIFISESTLTRQYRRWKSDIMPIPPAPKDKRRTWSYYLMK